MIQICSRHAIWANVNRQSKQAKRRKCLPCVVSQHNSYLRYIRPRDNARQTNRQKKMNVLKKQSTLSETNYLIMKNFPLENKSSSPHTVWMVWLIAKSLTRFLLSVVERQRICHANFRDLVHKIIKGNIEWCIISLHIFGKEEIS